MHGQMEQLATVTEQLDEQHLLLKEGSRQLRAFSRRIATGKRACAAARIDCCCCVTQYTIRATVFD